MTQHRSAAARGPRIRRRLALGALLCLGATACKDITSLEQEAPSRVLGSILATPENAPLLVRSAITDFECALANYVVATGLVGDELIDAQLAQVGWDYDRRTVFPSSTPYALTQCGSLQVPGLYTPLSTARYQADRVLELLEGWTDAQVPNRTSLIAQAAAYAGYSVLLLGEAMCSGAIDGGPELSRAQLFQEAEARFTRAIEAAAAANNAQMLNMARVGRARARLNLGQFAQAAADAALVPKGFVVNATYDPLPNRRQNLVHAQHYVVLASSVDPSFRNVTFEGVADPRVVVVAATNASGAPLRGADNATAIFRAAKYPTINSPIPIATWEEAQLILAEAAARANELETAVNIINALHDQAGIPDYDGGTQAEVLAQVLEERRRELFLEGQRLNDIIRFQIPLTPAAGTPFPVKGGLYGNQVCFPLPLVERAANPNIPDA